MNTLKEKHDILWIQWIVHQMLGMILENKVFENWRYKMIISKKCAPELLIEKYPENSLWKSDFGSFWHCHWLNSQIQCFPWSMLIFVQKSCFFWTHHLWNSKKRTESVAKHCRLKTSLLTAQFPQWLKNRQNTLSISSTSKWPKNGQKWPKKMAKKC